MISVSYPITDKGQTIIQSRTQKKINPEITNLTEIFPGTCQVLVFQMTISTSLCQERGPDYNINLKIRSKLKTKEITCGDHNVNRYLSWHLLCVGVITNKHLLVLGERTGLHLEDSNTQKKYTCRDWQCHGNLPWYLLRAGVFNDNQHQPVLGERTGQQHERSDAESTKDLTK